jgi:MoaA/NifB/PqqE/SkfB family radical SAM enzyme
MLDSNFIKNSKHFCVAPWTHVAQNVGGRVKPCCRFGDMFKEFPIDYKGTILEFFHSPGMNTLREKMLNDEYIDSCKKCYDEEKSNKPSLRLELNERYGDIIRVDDPSVRYLEIGLSNACNFACVTCASNYSTSWFEDDNKLLSLGFKRSAIKIDKFIITESKTLDIDLSKIDRIKILGGEPFMEPRNLELMERLEEVDALKNLELNIVSNASIMPSKKWIQILDKIKLLRLVISLDGMYDTAEFVRYGTDWNKVSENIKWWVNYCKDKGYWVQFHYVVHALNSLDIGRTATWCAENYPDIFVNYDCLKEPNYLNIAFLPKWWKLETVKIASNMYRVSNKRFVFNHLQSADRNYKKNLILYDYVEKLEKIRDIKVPLLYREFLERMIKDASAD